MAMREDTGSLDRLWGEGLLKVFISHKAEDKVLAKNVKNSFRVYGVTSFVAHEDIVPMHEWQSEIERALFSMDLLVALLTEKFSESNWTDQEIGVAIGRGVPVVPVRLGRDPYGFIGKYQAIRGTNASKIVDDVIEYIRQEARISGRLKELVEQAVVTAAEDFSIVEQSNILRRIESEINGYPPNLSAVLRETFAYENGQFDIERIFDNLIRRSDVDDSLRDLAKDAYISAVADASNFARANQLARYLKEIDALTYLQAEHLMRAFNENDQVNNAFNFEPIVAKELSRMAGTNFIMEDDPEWGGRILTKLSF
ncbi:MAG: toll/interleukin-1 receptor domain-containing protein [Chloroflexota bacterium]|nr:toll/interleukin-1 receptor domain-containing protein [Chloroflexota bacterium]